LDLFVCSYAFLYFELTVWVVRTRRFTRFSINSTREEIWPETHNRIRGWLPYQAKS
jgi:hypothetical protein